MSMIETSDLERRLSEKVNRNVTDRMALATARTGGLSFSTMTEVMEFARLMAISNIGVRKHLRGNVGACLAICVQALEWEMSPFAVASKSYSVNDQIAFEAQLINAVILKRAPIRGRMKVEYEGEGGRRVCRVSVALREDAGGGEASYTSPEFDRIQPKNSPLWKTDPDQQLFYNASRALCRRHFPDVLLGVYSVDEVIDASPEPETPPDRPRPRTLAARMAALTDDGDTLSPVEDAPSAPVDAESAANEIGASGGASAPLGTAAGFGSPDDAAGAGKGLASAGLVFSRPENEGPGPAPAQTAPPKEPTPAERAEQAIATKRAREAAKAAPAATVSASVEDDDDRALRIELTDQGVSKAARGSDDLNEWLGDLTDNERALLTPAVVRTWTSIASQADKKLRG